MIVLICYLYILLWDVDVHKEVFALLSTFELAGELIFLLFMSPIIVGWIIDNKRSK